MTKCINQTYIISITQIKIIKDYFDINEYVYVKYTYNDTDIDYKYGKIIKKYSDTQYIVHYDNDVAIISGNRISRSLEL